MSCIHTMYVSNKQQISDIDLRQTPGWKRSNTDRLIRLSESIEMTGSDLETFKEQMKSELVDQTRTIIWEMLTESKGVEREEREERQAATVALPVPPAPPFRPFDIVVETSGKQLIEDDQETLLAEPITRQRLDILKEIEKLDWAKDLIKTMTQMHIQMKEKGIEAPLNYTNLDLYKGNDLLP